MSAATEPEPLGTISSLLEASRSKTPSERKPDQAKPVATGVRSASSLWLTTMSVVPLAWVRRQVTLASRVAVPTHDTFTSRVAAPPRAVPRS